VTVANVQADAGASTSPSHAKTTTSSGYPKPHNSTSPDGSTPSDGTTSSDGNTSSDGTTPSNGKGSSGSSETFEGDATYYGIGLGACGWTNTEPDLIAAVSHALFDSFATAAAKDNPNLNPICGKMAHATIGGLGSVTVKIVDRCGGCEREGSLDFSMAAFNDLTNGGEAHGRYTNLTWHWA